MKKAIIGKKLCDLCMNPDYNTGEVMYAVLTALKVSKPSELLEKTDTELLTAVEVAERSMENDPPVSATQLQEWIEKQNFETNE